MGAISITAANVGEDTTYVGNSFIDRIAGATLTAGMACYYNSADGRVYACDNDVLASAECIGIASHGASAGQPLRLQRTGQITIGGTSAAGVPYFVGAGAGTIELLADVTTGKFLSLIGIGVSATKIKLGLLNSGVAV